MEKVLSNWLKFDTPEDEYASHEANVFTDGETFWVEWSHVDVGQVTTIPRDAGPKGVGSGFSTMAEADAVLERAGYIDCTG